MNQKEIRETATSELRDLVKRITLVSHEINSAYTAEDKLIRLVRDPREFSHLDQNARD